MLKRPVYQENPSLTLLSGDVWDSIVGGFETGARITSDYAPLLNTVADVVKTGIIANKMPGYYPTMPQYPAPANQQPQYQQQLQQQVTNFTPFILPAIIGVGVLILLTRR